ncbi:MAG: hypothetical protein FWG98_06820 [Candidatus Cloacimonetes bacterium]|nr:hypothetical protein [Candidatus Cloacimonadota bacterium]
MKVKIDKEIDYGHGITQRDLDEYNNRPKYLHNEKIRPDGQSLSEWLTEVPFMDGCTEEEKKEFIETVKTASGFYDYYE